MKTICNCFGLFQIFLFAKWQRCELGTLICEREVIMSNHQSIFFLPLYNFLMCLFWKKFRHRRLGVNWKYGPFGPIFAFQWGEKKIHTMCKVCNFFFTFIFTTNQKCKTRTDKSSITLPNGKISLLWLLTTFPKSCCKDREKLTRLKMLQSYSAGFCPSCTFVKKGIWKKANMEKKMAKYEIFILLQYVAALSIPPVSQKHDFFENWCYPKSTDRNPTIEPFSVRFLRVFPGGVWLGVSLRNQIASPNSNYLEKIVGEFLKEQDKNSIFLEIALNVPLFNSYLVHQLPMTTHSLVYAGGIFHASPVQKIGKWKEPEWREISKVMPTYATGACYILSYNIVQFLVSTQYLDHVGITDLMKSEDAKIGLLLSTRRDVRYTRFKSNIDFSRYNWRRVFKEHVCFHTWSKFNWTTNFMQHEYMGLNTAVPDIQFLLGEQNFTWEANPDESSRWL